MRGRNSEARRCLDIELPKAFAGQQVRTDDIGVIAEKSRAGGRLPSERDGDNVVSLICRRAQQSLLDQQKCRSVRPLPG